MTGMLRDVESGMATVDVGKISESEVSGAVESSLA